MKTFSKHIELANPDATLALGAALSAYVEMGDVLALRGDLGAGKTTMARGLIRALTKGLNGDTEVPSPTFSLVQIYETPKGELWHGDMYRLESPQACIELGLEDAFLDCICVIEWPDKLGHYLPSGTINITLSFTKASSEREARTARVEGARDWIEKLDIKLDIKGVSS